MASLKDLRRRIRATRSMQQIFKAMEMVAAAKLRRAQSRAQAASPYAKITEMSRTSPGRLELEHPLFKVRGEDHRAGGDHPQRGFCGTTARR